MKFRLLGFVFAVVVVVNRDGFSLAFQFPSATTNSTTVTAERAEANVKLDTENLDRESGNKSYSVSAPFIKMNEGELWAQWVAYRKDHLPRDNLTRDHAECNYNFVSGERLNLMADIYPDLPGSYAGGCIFCQNDKRFDDPKYIFKNIGNIKDGTVVAVLPNDIPAFITKVLPNVPKNVQFTLVSAHGDISTPFELFAGTVRQSGKDGKTNRHKFVNDMWSEDYISLESRVQKLLDFIKDTRLKHWYVQNYDLFGCGFWSHSPVMDPEAIAKVSPLPIGSSYYSKGNACRPGEAKEDELLRKWGAFRPWAERTPKILGGEGYSKDNDKKLSRSALNTAITRQPARYTYKKKAGKGDSPDGVPKNCAEFWSQTATVQFHLAPHGNGQDTHRLWEVIGMGSVPVVLTSALDLLFSHFPIIIVMSINDVTKKDAIQTWTKQIVDRFGPEPFTPEIRAKSRIAWWASLVRSGKPLFTPAQMENFMAHAKSRAEQWPLCHLPECQNTEKNDNDVMWKACVQNVVKKNREWKPSRRRRRLAMHRRYKRQGGDLTDLVA